MNFDELNYDIKDLLFNELPKDLRTTLLQSIEEKNLDKATQIWLKFQQGPDNVVPRNLVDYIESTLTNHNEKLQRFYSELPVKGLSGLTKSQNPVEIYMNLMTNLIDYFRQLTALDLLQFPSNGLNGEVGYARREGFSEKLEKESKIELLFEGRGIPSGWDDLCQSLQKYSLDPLLTLTLDQAVLDQRTMDQLAQVIDGGAKISNLNLRHCSWDANGFSNLCEAIKKNDSLLTVDLTDSKLSQSDFDAIVGSVKQKEGFTLCVTGCGIDPQQVEVINDQAFQEMTFFSIKDVA